MNNTKNEIRSFISDLTEKNYKDAQDSLQHVVRIKLAERIKQCSASKKETISDK